MAEWHQDHSRGCHGDDLMNYLFNDFIYLFKKLKTLCWGGPGCVPNAEWIKAGIIFNSPAKIHAFGLRLSSGAQKAFQVILQAYILKYLFFGSVKTAVKPAVRPAVKPAGGMKQRPSRAKPVNMWGRGRGEFN